MKRMGAAFFTLLFSGALLLQASAEEIYSIPTLIIGDMAESIPTEEVESKVYCKATLEDDFADDRLLAVITKEASRIQSAFTAQDFSCIQAKNVQSIAGSIDYLYDGATLEPLSAADIRSNTEAALTNMDDYHQIIEIELENPGKENVLKAIKELEKLDFIKAAEPNYYFSINEPEPEPAGTGITPLAFSPDSEKLESQASFTKIKAADAWEVARGLSIVPVGVIDSGIANHDDLSVSLTDGWDFYNDNSVTTDDPTGHGTHVAGIIDGLNWRVSLVPLQAINTNPADVEGNGKIDEGSAVRAVEYARTHNIPIINCSFGEYTTSYILKEAMCNYNGLIVCAAGNGILNESTNQKIGVNTDSNTHIPSCYSFDNIISVASTNNSDRLSTSSNYGKATVDLAAPGENIYSIISRTKYGNMSGTSMAAPHVTGVAALIKSAHPYLTAQQIKQAILDGVDKVSGLTGKCVTGGRLNAYKALSRAALCAETYYPADQVVAGDFNGNGKDDLAYIVYDSNAVYIYVRLNGENSTEQWAENSGISMTYVKTRVTAGDFNGDGKDDIALLYNKGHSQACIYVLLSSGSSFKFRDSWLFLSDYTVDSVTGRIASGDFNGDGKDDIAAMYDYGNGTMRIHVFRSTGTKFSMQSWYEDMVGGNFWASGVTGRFTAGDFNGDGKDDIAAMYGYADGRTRTHVWLSNGTSFNQRTAWFIQDTPNYYNTDNVEDRFVAGDFNGDGKDDIAAMYDYGSGTFKLHVFVSQGNTYTWWQSWYSRTDTGALYSEGVKAFVAGDFNGDGKDDLMARYMYQDGNTNLLHYRSTGSAFNYIDKFPYWHQT